MTSSLSDATHAIERRRRVLHGIDFLLDCGYDLTAIDLNNLSMGDVSLCVWGQLRGDYILAMNDLDMDQDEMIDLGFEISHNDTYEELTAEWRIQLAPYQEN